MTVSASDASTAGAKVDVTSPGLADIERAKARYLGAFGDEPETPDLAAIERQWRAGLLSNREIARQQGRSETWVRKLAKAKGWTRDLAGAVRHQVRESLVRDGVRANQCELLGVEPSDAAIIDEAAAIGVEVVRSHRRLIGSLWQKVEGLLSELRPSPPCAPPQRDESDGILMLPLKIIDRSRVISDLSQTMARLVPLERQAFGLDEDRPDGIADPNDAGASEGMPCPAYD